MNEESIARFDAAITDLVARLNEHRLACTEHKVPALAQNIVLARGVVDKFRQGLLVSTDEVVMLYEIVNFRA